MTLFTETLPPADQPYLVPENWVWVRFGQINTRISKTIDPAKRPDETFELYSVPSFDEQIPEFLTGEEIKSSKQLVVEGDVLLCKINPKINRVWMVGNFSAHKKIASSEWIVITPSHEIYRSYLLWCLQGHDFRNLFTSQVAGVGGSLMRARPKDVVDYPIPVPPLPEQRRIAAKLDALLGKLREARALIDEARESFALRRAAILHQAFSGKLTAAWRAEHSETASRSGELFDADIEETPYDIPETWKWVKLKEIGEIVTGTTPSKKRDDFYGNDFPLFKPTDLNQGYFVYQAQDNLSDLGSHETRILPEKSTMVTCIGATIGKAGFLRRKGSTNQQINSIVPSAHMIPEYVYWGVNSHVFQQSIIENASATTLPILNKSRFGNLAFPLAPFEEQREIVRQLESLLGHETAAAGLLDMDDELDLLEQSILSRAFRGGLGTNDPAEPPVQLQGCV